MALPIVPVVVVGGVAYYAATHKVNTDPPPPPGRTPPPGATLQQIRNWERRNNLMGAFVEPVASPKKSSGPVALDPTLVSTSQPGNGKIDPALQQGLDVAYAAAKAAFDKMDNDAKATAAGEINKEFNLTENTNPKALTADDSTNWDAVAATAGGAAGAAIGGYYGGPLGAKIGALVGAYCGVKLEHFLASLPGYFSSTSDAEFAAAYGTPQKFKAALIASDQNAAQFSDWTVSTWDEARTFMLAVAGAHLALAGIPHF